MGCGSFMAKRYLTEEEQQAFKDAEAFRSRLISEVRELRERTSIRRSAGSNQDTPTGSRRSRLSQGSEILMESKLSIKSGGNAPDKEKSSSSLKVHPMDSGKPRVSGSSAFEGKRGSTDKRGSTEKRASRDCESGMSSQIGGSHAMSHTSTGSFSNRPLVLQSAVSRSSLIGSEFIEAHGLRVTLPGKVGCDDDQVIFEEGEHMLMRTKKVHKNQWRAQKLRAQRRLQMNAPCRRRTTVRQEQSPEHHVVSRVLSEDEKKVVLKVLQSHFLFGSLEGKDHDLLVEQMMIVEKAKGNVICHKGRRGDACYIVVSGLCSVLSDESAYHSTAEDNPTPSENVAKEIAELSAGTLFGELALMYDVPRTATIICSSPRVCLGMIEGSTFRRTLEVAKERTLEETLSFLRNHATFSKLSLDEKMMLANALHTQTFMPGNSLIGESQSSKVDWMFLLQEGTVEVTDQYKNRKVLGEGACISGQKMPYGDQVVLAKALTKVRCLAIGKKVIDCLFGNIGEVLRRSTIRCFLDSVSFFRELTDKQQLVIAGLFQDQNVRKGEIIASPLAEPQLVLVLEGEVAVMELDCSPQRTCSGRILSKADASSQDTFDSIGSIPEWTTPHTVNSAKKEESDRTLRILHRGDVFGEDTFNESGAMMYTLVAQTDSKLSRAGHEEVCLALRGRAEKTLPIADIVLRNRMRKRLQAIFPFSALYEDVLDIVVESFEKVEYAAKEVILNPNETSDCFCLIVEGEAIRRTLLPTTSGEQQFTAPEPLLCWETFGIKHLLLGTPSDAEIVAAASSCCVMVLSQAHFQTAAHVMYAYLQTKLNHQDLHITRNDATVISKLGQGQFGIVNKVSVEGLPGEEFALKRMNKSSIVELEAVSATLLEREILRECCHPLIVSLIASFQDAQNVYLLMENLEGGDLFTAIRTIGVLNEEHTLFFSASIALALEYVHSRGVIYRDLKPENIMLDHEGFVKLVDFGSCSKKTRTYTFIGTPEYLAPEVVLGNSYGQAVDWWALGVIMYEMICGPLPFGENSPDPMETFREVLEKPLDVPSKVSAEARDILEGFLERQPEQRLGSSSFHSKNEVRVHPFFDGLQWDAILERSTMPPFRPQPAEAEEEEDDESEEGSNDADVQVQKTSSPGEDTLWSAFGPIS